MNNWIWIGPLRAAINGVSKRLPAEKPVTREERAEAMSVFLVPLQFLFLLAIPVSLLCGMAFYYSRTLLLSGAAAFLFICYEIVRRKRRQRFTSLTVVGYWFLIWAVLILAFHAVYS